MSELDLVCAIAQEIRDEIEFVHDNFEVRIEHIYITWNAPTKSDYRVPQSGDSGVSLRVCGFYTTITCIEQILWYCHVDMKNNKVEWVAIGNVADPKLDLKRPIVDYIENEIIR